MYFNNMIRNIAIPTSVILCLLALNISNVEAQKKKKKGNKDTSIEKKAPEEKKKWPKAL